LVCGSITLFDEWRVVGRYFSDITVFSVTKFGIVVAWGSVCSLRSGGSGSSCRIAGAINRCGG